jgi:hypothetical protein
MPSPPTNASIFPEHPPGNTAAKDEDNWKQRGGDTRSRYPAAEDRISEGFVTRS